MISLIFNQDTVIPGHPKFTQGEIYFLEKSLAEELVARGIVVPFTPKQEEKEFSKKPKKI